MNPLRLQASALWEVLQNLSERELHRLKSRVKGTRLEWLLNALRQMEVYSDKILLQKYQKAFPRADRTLLRSYKRKLWDVIEEILPTADSELVGEEVRIWQRFWVSFILWHRGVYGPAEVLWHQAMHAAVRAGWYETALWGISLLELYARDFHKLAPTESVSAWTDSVIGIVNRKYQAIRAKIAALESYVRSRHTYGWVLPPIPMGEAWTDYMDSYIGYIEAMGQRDSPKAIDYVTKAIQVLLEKSNFPPTYVRINMATSFLNMGIVLFNLEQWDLYEEWNSVWESLRQKGYFPRVYKYEELYKVALSLRIAYLVQACRWSEGERLWEEKKESIGEIIFDGSVNVLYRLSISLQVYLILLLTSSRYDRVVSWRLRVEKWMEQEGLREYPHSLWWVFLRWYEAYRSGQKSWMRHWYRKLRLVWREFSSEAPHWIAVLRVLKTLSTFSSYTVRRRVKQLLRHWEGHPEEKALWEEERTFFPMSLFIESLLTRRPLEQISYTPAPADHLPEELRLRIHFIFHAILK
ncbi:MAG: hypothetical protein N2170_08055 [Bacteroidia bacterium]|nr:hypothetical protein [Bacteroidia bacterium]